MSKSNLQEVYIGKGRLMVPDVVIEPSADYTYSAANGTGYLLVAFLLGKSQGWVKVESLGYKSAVDWLKDHPSFNHEAPRAYTSHQITELFY